jgi:hypothetical protein
METCLVIFLSLPESAVEDESADELEAADSAVLDEPSSDDELLEQPVMPNSIAPAIRIEIIFFIKSSFL